jgi:ParB-like chromosome segregation protein Spo0J
MTLKTVPITSINLPPDLEVDEKHVNELAESIGEIDLINPVTVNPEMKLLAGAHRYWGARKAGHTSILVHIVDLDEPGEALVTIDENLHQRTRSALERGRMFAQRKKLLEATDKVTKRGGPRKKGEKQTDKTSASASSADAAGVDERTIRRYVSVAEKLDPEAAELLIDTPTGDNLSALKQIAALPAAEQVEVAKKIAERAEKEDDSDERYTTDAQFKLCLRIAGLSSVHLDVAACAEAHRAERYYTKADNGLTKPWDNTWWCNPPWSDIRSFVEVGLNAPAPGLMLLPAWTDRAWWQELIEPVRDGHDKLGALWTRFLPRSPFGSPGNPTAKGVDQPHFWCVLVAFRLPMPWHARLSGERLPPIEPVQVQPAPPVKPTRPKKMFIDPNKETGA